MSTKQKIPIYVVGPSRSGKSSLIRRITENAFSSDYKFTYKGMSQPTTTVFTDDGDEICVSFRDEGDDIYQPCSYNMYKAFNTFIVVYDVSDQSSLQSARGNCNAIKMTRYDTDGTILVGNKCDLESAINPVDVKRFVRNEYLLHIETSAKENINIQEMLMLLLSRRLGKPCTGKWQPSSISSSEYTNTSLQKETTESSTDQSRSLSTSDSKKIEPQTVATTKSGLEHDQSLSISNSANHNSTHQNVTTPERSSCCVIS